MKSSTGVHYIALDQIRAVAAFMVFCWHFLHSSNGYPTAFSAAPAVFPLALFDEGHTGVALFMTLSGYLFAKLLDGKTIFYPAFIWNRIIRLAPLLIFVFAVTAVILAIQHQSEISLVRAIVKGIVLPTLPNGGWSITTEFHFYLILPVLLFLMRGSKWLALAVVGAAILLRATLFLERGSVQHLAYWTIVGRIDQFALGMLAFRLRDSIRGSHLLAVGTAILFAGFYWWFDRAGGFYHMDGYPSRSPLWVVFPTIEAVTYGLLIAWYDSSFVPTRSAIGRAVGQIGSYSYSIYLLHFFFVFQLSAFIDRHVMSLANFYVAMAWAVPSFLLMVPLGFASWHLIEAPCLRLRKRYIVEPTGEQQFA